MNMFLICDFLTTVCLLKYNYFSNGLWLSLPPPQLSLFLLSSNYSISVFYDYLGWITLPP